MYLSVEFRSDIHILQHHPPASAQRDVETKTLVAIGVDLPAWRYRGHRSDPSWAHHFHLWKVTLTHTRVRNTKAVYFNKFSWILYNACRDLRELKQERNYLGNLLKTNCKVETRIRYLTLQNSFNLTNSNQLIFLLATLLYSCKTGLKVTGC